MDRLDIMEQVLSCTSCELNTQCTSPVPFSGPTPARVAVIGEAPGQQEDEEGQPFVGPAGHMLRELLAGEGMEMASIAYLNTVSCFPGDTPQRQHVDACRINKIAQLKLIDPEFVLLLGKTAMNAVSPRLDIKKSRRRPFEQDGVVYMVAYHPSAALRNANLDTEFRDDIKAFVQLVQRGRERWVEMIPDTCTVCPEDGEWYSRSGLVWCPDHVPDIEREDYLARQRLLADSYAAARAALGSPTASDTWQRTMEDAAAAKAAGIAAADAGANEEWKLEALEAVLWCAENYDRFTADEVWARLDAVGVASTHEPSAIGPVFLRASQAMHWIRNTKETRPTIYARRHRDLTIWESLVEKEAMA